MHYYEKRDYKTRLGIVLEKIRQRKKHLFIRGIAITEDWTIDYLYRDADRLAGRIMRERNYCV